MSGSDVPFFEMDDNPLTDSNIEAVLSGDQTTGPSELHALFGGLRERFESSADVPVGAALAEFIDIVDLTTTASETAGTTRKRKMITGIGTFIATTTGKVVLGATVAAASVGGVHAADFVDVPGLPNESAEVIVVEELDAVEEPIEELSPVDVEEVDDEIEGADSVDDAVLNDEDAEDDDDEDASKDDDDDKNHGQVVSDFAHSTELEGCEKGQAISDLASSKANDKRHDDDDDEDDDDSESDDEIDDENESEEDNKCKDHDDDEDEDHDDDDEDHDDDDEDEDHDDDDEDHDDDDDDEDDEDDDDDDDEDDDEDDDDDGNGQGKGKAKGKNDSSSDDDED